MILLHTLPMADGAYLAHMTETELKAIGAF